jgi:hypothetical protein
MAKLALSASNRAAAMRRLTPHEQAIRAAIATKALGIRPPPPVTKPPAAPKPAVAKPSAKVALDPVKAAAEAAKARRRRVAEVVAALRVRCPKVFGDPPVPLKIGIGDDVIALLAGTYGRKVTKRALSFWTKRNVYLEALARGGARYDLDGTIAGEKRQLTAWSLVRAGPGSQ